MIKHTRKGSKVVVDRSELEVDYDVGLENRQRFKCTCTTWLMVAQTLIVSNSKQHKLLVACMHEKKGERSDI